MFLRIPGKVAIGHIPGDYSDDTHGFCTIHAGTVIIGIAISICTHGIKEGVNWKITQELGNETTGFNVKTKFCQDLLEVFFGKQRAQVTIPTSHQFL